ncbi:hypothetical protein [Streptomyces sp. NEAU-NA10]|uniref:hypothetical protein n=1 Tax=Streptomyces sp. NEAU-NA10 TaxID=3416050 RepID=UPI003CC648C2
MLENWYFCSALGLPPVAAADYLDVIAALQEPIGQPHSGELISAAVDRLAASDTALAVHALPHVLRALRQCVSEHDRYANERAEEPGHERCVCVREVTDRVTGYFGSIVAVVPRRLRPSMGALLNAAVSDDGDTAVRLLREALEAAREITDLSTDPSAPPYHDLLDQLVPTVLMTVSRFLADLRAQRVADELEDPSKLLSDSLRGRHGRLALIKAAELSAVLAPQDAASIVDELGRAARGSLDLEPDLLVTVARVFFALTASGDAGGFDRIEAEAMTCARLGRRLAHWRRTGIVPDAAGSEERRRLAYTRLGGTEDHRRSAMPSVLWQAALLQLAAELYPQSTSALLQRCWQAPDGPPRGERIRVAVPFGRDYEHAQLHVGRLLRLRGSTPDWRMPTLYLDDAPAATTPAATAARVWSPWVLPAPQGQQHDTVGAEQLVRLLGAGLLAVHLLSRVGADPAAGDGGRDRLLMLLVHIRDVLGNRYRVLLEEIAKGTAPASVPTGHLAALMLHVRAQTDRTGTGQRPSVHPAEIVRVVSRLHVAEPGATRRAEPLPMPLRNYQTHRTALGIALGWLQEAAAGGNEEFRVEASGRWFTPEADGVPEAARDLLDLADAQAGEPYRPAAVQAALLRREIYPGEPVSTLRWDWVGGRPQFDDPALGSRLKGLNYRRLLLSGPTDPDRTAFSVQEWADMAPELEKYVHDEFGIIPVTLWTLRLAALLQEPALGDQDAYAEWVSSWIEIVQSLNMPAHLPRWVRGRMFDMFTAPVGGPASQERALRVLEQVVDVVIDLSAGAPFYYDKLFHALTGSSPIPAGSANRLRRRALYSLYHRWGPGGLSVEAGNPFVTYAERVSARGTEAGLVRFLRETAHQSLEAQAQPLSAAMERLWFRAHKPPQFPAAREDIGSDAGRPRAAVAATADRRNGETVLYAPRLQLGTAFVGKSRRSGHALGSGERREVRNLFETKSPDFDEHTYVLGFVCAKDAFGQEPKLWINCGLPNLVGVDLAEHHRYRRVGDPVAVRVEPGRVEPGKPRKGHEVVSLASQAPAPGEVRPAELTPLDVFPWLSLSVEGIEVDRYPTGESPRDVAARRRWDPDLSRAFAGDETGGRPLRTLAVFHEEYQHWVPLDAGLAELSVAAGPEEADAVHRSERTVLRLVLEGPATDRSGYGPAWRFVTSPGRAYVLGATAWQPDDWNRLDDACSASGPGLVVHAEFRPGESRLRLLDVPSGAAPTGASPFDDRNLRWLALFEPPAPVAPQGQTEQTDGEEEADDTREQDLYHEAVRQRADGGRSTGWTMEVPETEGFPRRISVKMLSQPRRQDRPVLCRVETWGEPQARRARVHAQPVDETGIRETEPRPDRYAALARLRPGTVVDLVRQLGKKPARSDNLVLLDSGMVGLAATDSLTLTGTFYDLSHNARRKAVVTHDGIREPRPHRDPEPLADLTRCCSGLDDTDAIDRADTVDGLVMSRMFGADNALTLLRIWLRLGHDVVEAVVPVRSFDQESPSAGDHLLARRTADGWVFSVLQRRLRLRALWQWEDDNTRDDVWTPVGEAVGFDGTRGRTLLQHRSLPRLALGGEPEQGALAGHRAKAERLFRNRAVVDPGDQPLVGTVSGMVLGATAQTVRVERTVLRPRDTDVTLPVAHGTARFLDVEREFVLVPATPTRRRPEDGRRAADPKADWERFLQGPDQTITGPLVQDRLYLGTLRAPDDQGSYRNWLAAADEPRTLVVGRQYLEGRTRAVPVPHGAGYRFSHLRVKPLTVKGFMAEVLPAARADGTVCPIEHDRRPFYVGVENTEAGLVHRFEWGFGWFVDVPDAALTVGGGPVDPSGLALFHGDRIDAMSFRQVTEAEAPGGIAVSIALPDITKGVEYQIDQEAQDKVVHLLELDLDHESGRVAVLRVHTRSRGIDADRADEHVVGRTVGAYLDPEDARRLLARYGPDRRQQRILGRLVPEEGSARGRVRKFELVPPRPAPDRNSPGLHEGDSLYLEAGLIHPTTNDCLLRFGLPDAEEWERHGDPLEVTVTRREFSHRESVLRRALQTDGEDAYLGRAKMLVKLLRPTPGRPNRWNGSTKSPRTRPLRALRGYLENRGGSCFGVVDPWGRTIEVRPGVVFPMAGTQSRKDVTPGSVVRLQRVGRDGIAVRLAIPADDTYLGTQPRPVVVFPKDALRTQQDLERADEPNRFTLAGLPGVSATATKNFGAVLLREDHPKIAAVQVDQQAAKYASKVLVPLNDVEAGTLAFDSDDVVAGARRRRLAPAGTEPAVSEAPVPWAQLSFMDDTARGVAEACRTRSWTYHDTSTRQWVPDRDEPRTRRLPARARATSEPVFFSRSGKRWTLRHESESLQRFGYPATELLEEPRDDLAAGKPRAWAVARADRRSVWLELAPGRVAEVRGELVRFTDGHSLSDLDWSLFSPGDLIYGRVEGGVSECGHLVLDTWRPGARGALSAPAARRMLLPVTHHDETAGALFLGEGSGAFPFPAERAVLDAHPVGAAVWLDRANTVTAADADSVSTNDVVLLASDPERGGLRVLGLPRARVRLADEQAADAWPGCAWLRAELASAERGPSALLSALGSVPVTVEQVSSGPEPVLTVSRRAQPRSIWPKGVVLAQPVADLGRGFVAVRSGSALFRLHIKQIVPGLPDKAGAAAAAAFVRDTEHVRLYWNANAKVLSSGQPAGGPLEAPGPGEEQEIPVRAWLPVNDGEDRALGVVVRDERLQRAYWLPARECSWTTEVKGTTLFEHLRGRRRLTVLRDGPGTVTLRGLPLVERAFRGLAPGRKTQVRLVSAAEPSGRHLVSVEPLGMLATYAPVATCPHQVGASLMAEVATLKYRQGQPVLTLVEPESRLTVTDLPEWMSDALGRLRLNSGAGAQPVAGLVPERFAAYGRSHAEGVAGRFGPGPGEGPVEEPLPQTEESEEQRVLRAWGLLNSRAVDSADAERHAARAVVEWLQSVEGRTTLLQRDAPVDAAPALAACAIGARLASKDAGGARGALPVGWVVFLLARIGQRALSSLHTEALVTQWLTVPERHLERGGSWRRLRAVDIAPRLTSKQLETVVQFGEAMTGPTRPGEGEPEAAAVARGLLAAVGRLPSAHILREDARILRPLAELGTGLLAPVHSAVSQRRLLQGQISLLNRAVREVVDKQVPLTLLPAFEPLTAAGRKFAWEVVRAAERQSRQT